MLAHGHEELKDAQYVVFVNSSRRYVDCSQDVVHLLGYSRDELLARTIDDISYDVGAVPKLFELYKQNGAMRGEFILQHRDHTPVPIRYRAFVFDDGCNAAIWEPVHDWRLPYMRALLELNSEKQKRFIDEAIARMSENHGVDEIEQRVRHEAAILLRSIRQRLR